MIIRADKAKEMTLTNRHSEPNMLDVLQDIEMYILVQIDKRMYELNYRLLPEYDKRLDNEFIDDILEYLAEYGYHVEYDGRRNLYISWRNVEIGVDMNTPS